MHGAGRVRDRRLADAAVLFDRLHRRFQIARVVERVEHAHDADAVFDGLGDEFFHHVVRIMAVAEQVLAAQQHLDGRLLQISFQRAQALPRVFVQKAEAGIEGGAAPRFQRIIADIVQLFQHGDHFIQAHARRRLRLVRVTQDGIRDHHFFCNIFSHCYSPKSS